ncbi:DNA gyrase inhibitor YacG [Nitrincola tibetensis]|uniref:DNA gyrase inhibitor YacG n=1 Tax=Nitrincola tibetensis TaxID=2219697 RepID=A0A364NRH9_9GAMM|nr:DNA gyrase inhibitor YacG [Nitrincola tibetensis]RAU19719.1 DNA gyrase inhibitor YacG [Nitrincola tibetensis]
MPVKQIKCPQCETPTLYDVSNPWRPFCSERCKLIDLGEWASEGYQIPLSPEPDLWSDELTDDGSSKRPH